jgi:hypothetical protein
MRTIWTISFLAFILSASAGCAPLHSHDRDAAQTTDQGSQQKDKAADTSDD